MLAFLFTPFGKALGAAVVAIAVFSAAYLYGESVGRQDAAVEALERSVEVLRERSEVNEQVSSSDASDLCGSMGLPEQDRIECVRRLVEADSEPEHVGDDLAR